MRTTVIFVTCMLCGNKRFEDVRCQAAEAGPGFGVDASAILVPYPWIRFCPNSFELFFCFDMCARGCRRGVLEIGEIENASVHGNAEF